MSDSLPGVDDAHLVEVTIAREDLFQGKFLRAVRETVRLPDGGTSIREFILHPGAVMVVPMLDDGRVVLERQYRHPVREVLIEFPAGKLDPGEDRFACIRRELLEETGYTAREWARATEMRLAVGYSDEFIEVWFARGLSRGAQQLDEGEFIEVIAATPQELLQWCAEGKVKDSKTLVAAMWLQNVNSGTWKLDWRPHTL
ncbi:NUDIX domain-containing protein [Ramlibacter sp.]|uniref:NUDIX domain-containing protein n=1 Tax=Ramlibacter sp. TaxID=1917967 RepID=UPI003D0B9F31